MARQDEKTRTAFWLEKDLLKRCDACCGSYGFSSRNEFVNRAIENFIAQQMLQKENDIITQKLSDAIAKATDDGMVKISKGLFRYAVELEMVMHIISNSSEVTHEDIEKLRKLAINDVRRTRGKISFESITDFQKG